MVVGADGVGPLQHELIAYSVFSLSPFIVISILEHLSNHFRLTSAFSHCFC
jgi:hypothetical protein